jgi:hypothetical protein
MCEYFEVSWEYLNDEQLLAKEELLKWIANRKDMMDARHVNNPSVSR